MRSSKIALSAVAIAFALSGTAYAATPAQPAANAAVHHAAAPAKHRLFKRHAAKKTPDQAKPASSASTSAKTPGAR